MEYNPKYLWEEFFFLWIIHQGRTTWCNVRYDVSNSIKGKYYCSWNGFLTQRDMLTHRVQCIIMFFVYSLRISRIRLNLSFVDFMEREPFFSIISIVKWIRWRHAMIALNKKEQSGWGWSSTFLLYWYPWKNTNLCMMQHCQNMHEGWSWRC